MDAVIYYLVICVVVKRAQTKYILNTMYCFQLKNDFPNYEFQIIIIAFSKFFFEDCTGGSGLRFLELSSPVPFLLSHPRITVFGRLGIRVNRLHPTTVLSLLQPTHAKFRSRKSDPSAAVERSPSVLPIRVVIAVVSSRSWARPWFAHVPPIRRRNVEHRYRINTAVTWVYQTVLWSESGR